MIKPELIIALTALGAVGMWLMLPRGGAPGRKLGVLLTLISLGTLAWQMNSLGERAATALFCLLAGGAVLAALAAVTFRNPVHCAIWFALSLLATAGLFLFQGAQFLGVATVVIYAGAILVTFLFVLMLAQPQGDAFYDRISWEGLLSSCTGALLTAGFTIAIVGALVDLRGPDKPTAQFNQEQLNNKILAIEHVASLGGQLFSTYIIAIEIAGTLLLVGLVGAVAIVARASRFAPPTKQAPPRIDPAIVTGREPIQSMEFAGQEVSHG